MKFILASSLTSLQLASMDIPKDKQPTKFLFEAIQL